MIPEALASLGLNSNPPFSRLYSCGIPYSLSLYWYAPTAAGQKLSIAVNLSARSFLDSQLLDDIPELLAGWDVDPSMLELEITESMIVGDPQRARLVLDRLNELGITLAIDDFGTGYSSLAYLRQLPVDEIKIDKSFVLQMAGSASDETWRCASTSPCRTPWA